MHEQFLLIVIGATVLLGAALFVAMRVDRRRQNVQLRMRQFVAAAPSQAGPEPSVRRPAPAGGWRSLFRVPADLQQRFDAALAATGDRIRFLHLAIIGAVAALAAMWLSLRLLGSGPLLAAAIGAAAALAAAAGVLWFFQARFQKRFLDAFPDALDLVARAVRAGLPVFDAMEVASHEIREPVGGEFRRIIDELRIGVEIEDALRHGSDRIRVADFLFFVVAITLQRRTGGRLAETLANLSNIIRRRKEVRLKTNALTAEARASAMVLTLLPFFVGAALVFIARPLMQTLWLDPRGRFMVGVALVSLFMGSAVMHHMIKRALR